MKKSLALLLTIALVITSCEKYEDVPVVSQEEKKEDPKTADDYPVQNFMWQAMNAYYFWQSDVPNLADTKFTGVTDSTYVSFLASKTDPADFYYNICYKHKEVVGNADAVDRFSTLNENYKDLVKYFQGVSKSDGLQYGLGLLNDQQTVYGFVHYVAANSDAATKDIKRGDFFTGVNGQSLNIDNYIDLLFGDDDTYTLNMATVTNNTLLSNNKEVSLTKQADFAENPILISKIIETNGLKIGYIMYNAFVANYDDELNEKFGEFAACNIDELILDFRYNGGGRVSSAVQISSAVYGAKTDELFLKARYNDKIQKELTDDQVNTNFTDATFDTKTTLNTLGLNKVYVIATERTASASELVMNGLAPYVDVIHVGTKTVGKNEFSVTFVDDPENGFNYDPSREDKINPKNQWAIQPLLGRNENADGFSDYTDGLSPDYELREDVLNLGVLGDINEPLLMKTLDIITGSAKRNIQPVFPAKYIGDSKMFNPLNGSILMKN